MSFCACVDSTRLLPIPGTDLGCGPQIRRPFSWINSRIYISTPSSTESEADETVIGEAQQEFHVWRRRYHHFVKREGVMEQFGETDR